MPKAFRMKVDSKVDPSVKAGTTVYEFSDYDYGCARDDTIAFGYPCVAVTLDPTGDGPFLIVPERDLEPLGKTTP